MNKYKFKVIKDKASFLISVLESLDLTRDEDANISIIDELSDITYEWTGKLSTPSISTIYSYRIAEQSTILKRLKAESTTRFFHHYLVLGVTKHPKYVSRIFVNEVKPKYRPKLEDTFAYMDLSNTENRDEFFI